MDERELALELLKLYLQHHRERVSLEELVKYYLYILATLMQIPAEPPTKEKDPFDFREPVSLSEK